MSEQMTVHLHNRDEFQKYLKQLTVEYDDVYEASRSELYTAVTRVAMDHPNLLRCKLAEVRAEQADTEFTPASELDS